MKLNKVLALALSGVMAVSMLAGCSGKASNGGETGEGETPIVESGAAANVIAALDSETKAKVSFSSNSALQTTLETAIRFVGMDEDIESSDIRNAMLAIDSDLSNEWAFPYVSLTTWTGSSEDTDKEEQSIMDVIVLDNKVVGADEAYAARLLAETIDAKKVGYSNSANVTLAFSELSENSKNYDDSENNGYWYDFSYTGDMAFAQVTDAVSGQITYVVAYTATRTPTKTNK